MLATLSLYLDDFLGFLIFASFFLIPIVLVIIVFIDSRKLESRGVSISPVVSSLIVFISSLILAVISNFEFWIFKDYVIRSIMSLIPGLIYLLIRNFKHKKTEEKLNISLNKKPRSIVQLILIIVVPILLLFLAMVYLMRNFQL